MSSKLMNAYSAFFSSSWVAFYNLNMEMEMFALSYSVLFWLVWMLSLERSVYVPEELVGV